MSSVGRKSAVYSKSDDPSAVRDERMSRLKFELREHIRFLSDYELLSPDWLRMAESLHQIANVAFMETHLPPSEDNPLTQQGKKSCGTLWDQERDELAIRILLEEGKLNLALRLLHKYRIAIRDNAKWESMLKTSSEKNKHELSVLNERCKVFEQSVGVLIRFSLAHIEAVQIIDMPEFIQHCLEIFDDALSAKSKWSAAGTDGEKMQETLVIYYLAAIASKIEELDEDRVMDLIEEHQLLLTFLKHINANYTLYKVETLEAAAKFLNGIFSSEAYQTERDRFLPNNDVKKQLVNLKGFFVNELIASYGLKRKDVQTLLDEFTKFEKSVGPTTNVPLKLKSSAAASTGSEGDKKDAGKAEKK